MEVEFSNLNKTKAFNLLKEKGISSSNLSVERIQKSEVNDAAGLKYNWAAMPVDEETVDLLQNLADEQQLIEKYQLLLKGERINTGENRLVLHHMTRGSVFNTPVEADEENKKDFYQSQLERIQDFAFAVRSGTIKGSTGRKFNTVVQIGIGGSDLGPRALYLALRELKVDQLKAHFISNVDPDDAAEILKNVDLETTLFIIVSKSGTTQETLTNRDLVFEQIEKKNIPGFEPSKHFVAVTSKTSPLASSEDVLESFFIDDYIGGRYSSTSAVGGVVLSLVYGFGVFDRILKGAHEQDVLSLEKNIRENPALLDALIGVYLRNILEYPYTAILPYSQQLCRFPAHLQQLDMESNGKHVNRFGGKVDYSTGPVVFGESGTNGQHSFYQLLHQGTDIVPLQFIGFKKSQSSISVDSQKKLGANLAAQIVAFSIGKEDGNPNKVFEGNRPSSLIYGDELTPERLGALLAHFENKVMFQGFCWNLNSFDQEGVQLGKILAKKVLNGCEGDRVLEEYAKRLGC